MMNFKNAQKVRAKCLIKFTDTYSTCLVKNPFHLYNYNDPGAIDLKQAYIGKPDYRSTFCT